MLKMHDLAVNVYDFKKTVYAVVIQRPNDENDSPLRILYQHTTKEYSMSILMDATILGTIRSVNGAYEMPHQYPESLKIKEENKAEILIKSLSIINNPNISFGTKLKDYLNSMIEKELFNFNK